MRVLISASLERLFPAPLGKYVIPRADYFQPSGEKSSTVTLSVSSVRARTWEERKEAPAKAAKKAAKPEEPQVEMPKVEKTTLGDLSALAELKASMEAEEKPAKKAPAKKAAKKTEE